MVDVGGGGVVVVLVVGAGAAFAMVVVGGGAVVVDETRTVDAAGVGLSSAAVGGSVALALQAASRIARAPMMSTEDVLIVSK